MRLLLLTGGEAEVRGRAADIMDVALKTGHLYDLFGLRDHTFVAARLDIPPLMEGERAEVACTKAATVVDNGELHLLDRRHTAQRFIGRVVGAHIRQGVDVVHLFGGQGLRRRVLDHHAPAVALQERLAAHVVLFVVLQLDRAGVVGLIGADILIGRALDGLERQTIRVVRQIGCAAHANTRLRALFTVL